MANQIRTFTLTQHGNPIDVKITVEAPMITGAEQNIVILDADGKALAVVQMLPGVDRREEK